MREGLESQAQQLLWRLIPELRFPSTTWLQPRSQDCVQMHRTMSASEWRGVTLLPQGPWVQTSFHLWICKDQQVQEVGYTLITTTEPQATAVLESLCVPPQQHEAVVKGCLCHRALDILTRFLWTPPVPHRNPTSSPLHHFKKFHISLMEFKPELSDSWTRQTAGDVDGMILSSTSHASQGSLWTARKKWGAWKNCATFHLSVFLTFIGCLCHTRCSG